MKRETFTGIISLILEQKEREDQFGEAVKNAYLAAGECSDFRDAQSYQPATNVFIDAVLEKLACEFVSEHQTLEAAQDLINYYMYDLSLMNWQFIEPKEPGGFEVCTVPAYVVIEGVKRPLSTPDQLYDVLIYCAAGHAEPEETITPETKLRSALYTETKTDHVGDTDNIEYEIKKIISEYLSMQYGTTRAVSDIAMDHTLREDLGLDSLDVTSLMCDVEDECNVVFREDWYPDTVSDLVLMTRYLR